MPGKAAIGPKPNPCEFEAAGEVDMDGVFPTLAKMARLAFKAREIPTPVHLRSFAKSAVKTPVRNLNFGILKADGILRRGQAVISGTPPRHWHLDTRCAFAVIGSRAVNTTVLLQDH